MTFQIFFLFLFFLVKLIDWHNSSCFAFVKWKHKKKEKLAKIPLGEQEKPDNKYFEVYSWIFQEEEKAR